MTGSYIEAGTLAWFPASVRQLFDAVYLTPGRISYPPENWYVPSIQILHLQQNQEKGAELGGRPSGAVGPHMSSPQPSFINYILDPSLSS